MVRTNGRSCNLAFWSQSLSYVFSRWCRPQLGLASHAVQGVLSITWVSCTKAVDKWSYLYDIPMWIVKNVIFFWLIVHAISKDNMNEILIVMTIWLEFFLLLKVTSSPTVGLSPPHLATQLFVGLSLKTQSKSRRPRQSIISAPSSQHHQLQPMPFSWESSGNWGTDMKWNCWTITDQSNHSMGEACSTTSSSSLSNSCNFDPSAENINNFEHGKSYRYTISEKAH